jgi:hypothetical protein
VATGEGAEERITPNVFRNAPAESAASITEYSQSEPLVLHVLLKGLVLDTSHMTVCEVASRRSMAFASEAATLRWWREREVEQVMERRSSCGSIVYRDSSLLKEEEQQQKYT